MRVVLHPEAFAELEAAFYWYEGKAVNLGQEFLEEVDWGVAAIRESPMRWPLYREEFGVRRFLMHRFPFAIVYRVINDEIEVVAITHLRRRPGYWRNRLDR
jgi:plasmid stabilization system protein ParE